MNIPETLKLAVAQHNKKGNATGIDTKAYFVLPARLMATLTQIEENGGLDAFVTHVVNATAAFNQNRESPLELLGYELAVGEHPEHGILVQIVTYAGRAFTEDERFINDAIGQLDAKKMDWQTMMNEVKAILPPEAFERFRAVLSKAGMDKRSWNALYAPELNKPATSSKVIVFPGVDPRFTKPEGPGDVG